MHTKQYRHKPIRIIHVEDDEDYSFFVQDVSRAQGTKFEYNHCYDKEGFKNLLRIDLPDVVLCDHNLPGFGPLDALQCMEELNLKVAFILVTGKISEDDAVKLMQRSIDDYIMKDRLWRLPVAIQNAIRRHSAEKIGNSHLNLIIRQANKFRALIENSHEVVVLCDQTFQMSYISPSALQMPTFSHLRPHEKLTRYVNNQDV